MQIISPWCCGVQCNKREISLHACKPKWWRCLCWRSKHPGHILQPLCKRVCLHAVGNVCGRMHYTGNIVPHRISRHGFTNERGYARMPVCCCLCFDAFRRWPFCVALTICAAAALLIFLCARAGRRIYHLMVADNAATPGATALHCSHASPSGGGVCTGTRPRDFCEDFIADCGTGYGSWSSVGACMQGATGLITGNESATTGDTLNCSESFSPLSIFSIFIFLLVYSRLNHFTSGARPCIDSSFHIALRFFFNCRGVPSRCCQDRFCTRCDLIAPLRPWGPDWWWRVLWCSIRVRILCTVPRDVRCR